MAVAFARRGRVRHATHGSGGLGSGEVAMPVVKIALTRLPASPTSHCFVRRSAGLSGLVFGSSFDRGGLAIFLSLSV